MVPMSMNAVCQSVWVSRMVSPGASTDAPMPPADCWMPTATPSFFLNQAATVVGILTRNMAWAMPKTML